MTIAQLVVRNLEDSVLDRLWSRATRHGRSVEEEVRDILRATAAQEDAAPPAALGSRISARFAQCGLRENELLEFRHAPR